MFKPGIGTYSIATLEDTLIKGMTLEDEFKKIAELGYSRVEILEQDLEYDTADIKRWADESGLQITSIHAKPTKEIVEKMAELGAMTVIWPSAWFCNKAEAIETAEELDALAEMAEPYGIKIGYHNHTKEFYFSEGKTLLEHMLDNSSKFYLQLDCGWSMCAGIYPPYMIRKYAGRVFAVHVKENSRVLGPGARPASRYADNSAYAQPDFSKMTMEEKVQYVKTFNEQQRQRGWEKRTSIQCRMNAPESNQDWKEIKKALDEQEGIDAFWVVEREGFYADRYTCLADDCKWLKENLD